MWSRIVPLGAALEGGAGTSIECTTFAEPEGTRH